MKNKLQMKKGLALFGQGKWKSALGHTLLLIGMVLFTMGGYAQTPTGGLYMHKTWVPDYENCPSGDCGYVRLETFVTGSATITHAAVPSDIVVVLDQSTSMSYSMSNGQGGTTTRLAALQTALNTFVASVYQDATENNCDHRIAIVGFGSMPGGYVADGYTASTTYTNNNNTYNTNRTTNTELLTPSQIGYNNISNPNDYRNALLYVNNNGSLNTALTTAINNVDDDGGTMMHYGLEMAKNILQNRLVTTFDPDNDPSTLNDQPRNQVVVFFTDGYPGIWYPEYYVTNYNRTNRFAEYNPNYLWNSTTYHRPNRNPDPYGGSYNNDDGGDNKNDIAETVANAAVIQARALKENGATVFSVGIFDGADPTLDYQTQKKSFRPYYTSSSYNADVEYYYWEPANWTYSANGPHSGDAAANGLMHFISSNYTAAETAGTTPWSTLTTASHPAGDHNNGKYFAASNAAQLNSIFASIASESGSTPIEMGAGTIVQDVVSTSFQLQLSDDQVPTDVIKAYAPKCIGKNGDTFLFETEIDGTDRLELGQATINGETVTGVVIGGDENRLPDDVIDYNMNTKTLSFDGFNFKAMFVAQKEENGHPINEYTGRKLVMLIPIEIEDGSWGDGIETNGPMSVIFPDGSTDTLYFNTPTANVLGSVWTEVITTKPTTFPEVTSETQTIEIGTPEDLAWFISEVNGRIGYNVHDGEVNTNNVASHPKLNGKLTADIDMSAHNWVPIGCGWQVEIGDDGLTQYKLENGEKVHMVYEGTFDGNGYVITGLKNNASKYYKQVVQNQGGVVVFPGMFSDVKGTIKNVFVLDADFRGKHHNEHFVHHGIIADTLEAGGKIFNCEAAGRITCNNDDPTNDQQLIYGGLVGLNQGIVHSCMAMAELTAYTMGGMIGENRSTFYNGFTNGIYNYLGSDNTYKVGGIAGKSTGSITNCYVRFSRKSQNLNNATFGHITGSGSYTLSYSPEELAGMVPAGNTVGNRIYKIAQPSQWIRPTYYDNTLDDTRDKMLDELNANKGNGGTSWKRTTAGGYQKSLHGGNINGDYPVLKIESFGDDNNPVAVTCLGSADGVRIDYSASLKEMLHRHNSGNMNENTNISNNYTAINSNFYKVTGHEAINAGTINLYKNDNVTLADSEDSSYESTDSDVIVYIDENISLLQGDNSTITAYTGQNLTNFGGSATDIQAGNRWHNVSSSLSNSQLGITYGITTQVEHNWEARPCTHSLNQNDDDVAIFPTDMGYHNADLYCFFEPQYHWINFRRNGLSHWHMDLIDNSISAAVPTNHAWIDYYYYEKNGTGFNEIHDNETQLIPGKGYLMAINAMPYDTVGLPDRHLIQNRGTLNNGTVTIPVTYTDANEWTGLAGYNLLGNPYQSFLDFDAFVTGNSGLWANSNFANTYGLFDPSEGNYIQYASGSSKGSRTAGQFINMHQGFFIQVNEVEEGAVAHFDNTMRTNNATPNFRGEQPTYPLINFILTDNEGNTDIAVLEVDRPENDGAKKLRMGSPAGRIYFRYNDEDLGVYFRNSEKDYQTLYFAAKEDGNFTLNWERANDSFNSLTLVDNITGVKTNMLTHDHYTFEGRSDDYTTRFKIVFGTSNNEEEEEGTTVENFAFFNNGNLIVNGEGRLDVIDVLGRIVYSAELTDTQNTVSLPQNAKGVCMLRLTNGDNVKVQKMFVR